MGIGDRIRRLREKRQWSQLFLAQKLGIHNSVLSRIEAGKRPVEDELLAKISDVFGVSVDYLLCLTDDPRPVEDVYPTIEQIIERQGFKLVPIPILGHIHAGESIYAEENIIDLTAIPEAMAKNGKFFALRVIGDCMAGGRKPIEEGDLVIVREQPDVENGQIAVVLWPEVSEAQLRRIYKMNGHIILRADNPAYPPEIVQKDDLRIVGLVVSVQSEPAAAKEL